MTNKGSKTLAGAAYLWGLGALALSLFVSWRYNSSLAADPTDQTVQGLIAVACDLGPAILVVAMTFALKYRSWLVAMITGIGLAGFLALSFVNVLGYSATGAFAKVENAKVANAQAELSAAKQNELMLEERAADKAELRRQINVALKKKDRATAEMLYAQLGIQAATAPKLAQAEAQVLIDPQARMIAKHTGSNEETAREYRAAGMSAFLLLAKLFGLGLGAHFWPRRREETAVAAAASVPAPVEDEGTGGFAPAVTSPPVLRVVNDNEDETSRLADSLFSELESDDLAARRARDVAIVNKFLDEMTLPRVRSAVHSRNLYEAYIDWSDENPPMSATKFGKVLSQEGQMRGILRGRDAGGNNIYTGLALLVDGHAIATAA